MLDSIPSLAILPTTDHSRWGAVNQDEADLFSALDDIKASIAELRFYRENIFIPVEPRRSSDKPSVDASEHTDLQKTAI